jgi:signal transduction histidine kinase
MSTFFGMYSVVCYGVWRYLVPTLPSSRFHIVVSLLDLIFVVVLLAITGGPDSPLSRGLYIWVSMAAIMFGYRGGWLVAPVAAIVFIALEAYEGWSLDGWERTFYLLGFLIHGPFIGAISSRERNRSEALEVLNSRLELAHGRLKAHQARAIQSEKSATVGLLGASLAHEINNPVMGMKACISGLRREGTAPSRRNEYLDTIENGLTRIGQSVQSVLSYARPTSLPAQELDLRDVIDNSVRLVGGVAAKKRIQIKTEAVTEETVVWAGPGQLEQALVNIMLNAIYASPQESVLTNRIHQNDDGLIISILDQGPGFDEALLHRLRDPFFTTKPEGSGTGLGLSVTDGIMRGLGGQLVLKNGVNGAVVSLIIPIRLDGGKNEGVSG